MRRKIVFAFFFALVASSAVLASAAKSSKKDKKLPGETAFVHEGKNWRIHKSNEGRAFFYNVETGKSQWTDPRIQPLSGQAKAFMVIGYFFPFLLMVVGGVGYIYWVKSKHPELLKGPKKVKGLKNWERALLPPKIAKPKDRKRGASPTPTDAASAEVAKKTE
ncbi:hypothetical protein Agub_g8746 [Astrephomene gubernaculifera]|uniref:WW domain-containing protein n=1 Tax=Astrephomene gubernaculifera TaxID=47775 RepID=A0AAD3HNH5_9CHLO|nr:hypothetical protein Agub_g8746 [Astrephomene gubernaculifera]